MKRPLRRTALFALLTGLPLAGPLRAQTPDPAAQARRDIAALRADVEVIQRIRDDLRSKRPPATDTPLTFTLRLDGFLAWPNRFGDIEKGALELVLFRAGGKTLALPGVCPAWRDGAPNPVDPAGLRFGETDITGHMRVSINDYSTRVETVTLTLAITGRAISGTYTSDGSGGTRTVTGSVQEERAALVPPPTHNAPVTASLPEEQYALAQWLDTTARILYQDIRAQILARDGACSYPHACRLAILDIPVYPPLPVLSASGKVERETAQAPSLDDALENLSVGLDDPGGRDDLPSDLRTRPGKETRDAGLAALQAAAAGYISAIRDRVARQREVAERAVAATATTVVTGDARPDDPLFGPWYGQEALTSTAEKPNRIPADAGSPGQPSWPWIADWTCVGPFPRFAPAPDTPQWPEIVPGAAFAHSIGNLKPVGKAEGWPVPVFTIGKGRVEEGTGFVRSPHLFVSDAKGVKLLHAPHTTLYATSDVFCEAERDLWVGVTVNDLGKLWINDRLVWVSPPDKAPRHNAGTYTFKIRFKQGLNRLLFRCDNDRKDAGFSVRVCVRGQPRSPAEIARAHAVSAPPAPSIPAGRGWRYDGTGRYPDARPPLAWDADRGINVRWRVPLAFSHATPLIVGDLVVTLEEPDLVIAMDKRTGRERWRAPVDLAVTRDARTQADSKDARARATAAKAELARLGPGRRERLDSLIAAGLDAAAADARLKELDGAARAQLDFLKRLGVPEPGWYRDIGYTYATPVTDGTNIYVKLYTGALGCLDLNGVVRWVVDHGLVTSAKGGGEACPSPVLVNGKVILFGPAEEKGAPTTAVAAPVIDEATAEVDVPPPAGGSGLNAVRAFDAASGRRLWSTPLRVEDRFYFSGTPMPMRLTRGNEVLDVIATPNGAILRADDGQILRRFVGAREQYGSPVADGAIVCYSSNSDKAAFELILVDRDTIGVKPLWTVDHVGVFQDGNYGLFLDGKLHFARPNLDVTDVRSGALLWVSDNIFFAPPGRGYPPLALAGGRLYAADNAQWFQPTYRPYLIAYPGALSVVEPGVPGLVLARNRIEQVHGGYAFDGDCLYVRSMHSLMCFGHTGETGRVYEAETVAAEILRGFLADRPGPEAPLVIPAAAAGQRKPLVSATRPLGIIRAWVVAGPFPASAAVDAATALRQPGGPGLFAEDAGVPLAVAGVTRELKVLNTGNMLDWAADTRFALRGKEGFRRGPHIGWEGLLGEEIDWARVMPASPGAVALLGTLLVNEVPCLARFDAGQAPIAAAWLGDVEIRHGQCVALPAGTVPLVLAVRLDEASGASTLLRPRLWPSQGPQGDLVAWTDRMRRCRPYLENVIACSPDSPIGKRARAVLAGLP